MRLSEAVRLPAGHRWDWLPLAIIIVLALAGIIVAVIITPSFLTLDNIRAILRNASIVGIVAVAMTPMTLSGNFVSLAIGQSAMLSMVCFVALVGDGWPQPLAMLVVVVGLIAVGVMQGAIVATGLNPIIITLAAGAIIFGVVTEITGAGIVRTGDYLIGWGSGTVVGIPIQVLIFLIFTVVVSILMSRTVLGRETTLGRRQPGDRADQRHLVYPRHHRRIRDLLGRPRHCRHPQRRRLQPGHLPLLPQPHDRRDRRAAGGRHGNPGGARARRCAPPAAPSSSRSSPA